MEEEREAENVTEKKQADVEGRQEERGIAKVKAGESYKKGLLRNGSAAAEKSSRVSTGEVTQGLAVRRLLLGSADLGTGAAVGAAETWSRERGGAGKGRGRNSCRKEDRLRKGFNKSRDYRWAGTCRKEVLESGGQEKDNLWRKDIRGNRVRHWSKLGRKAAH